MKKEQIKLTNQDIMQLEVEAIVNPANPSLLGLGGLSGIILKAGGQQLVNELQSFHGTDVGVPVITKGYETNYSYIIHVPGPVYDHSNINEIEQDLYDSYYNTLALADDYQIKSIAFPAISTGIYQYPIAEATPIALQAIFDFKPKYLEQVVLCIIDADNYKLYQTILDKK